MSWFSPENKLTGKPLVVIRNQYLMIGNVEFYGGDKKSYPKGSARLPISNGCLAILYVVSPIYVVSMFYGTVFLLMSKYIWISY